MYPSRSNFWSGAPRAAWFYVVATPTEAGSPRWFIVHTEGMRAIAGLQLVMRSLGSDLAVTGRIDQRTLSEMQAPHVDAVVIERILRTWLQLDAAARSPVDAVMGGTRYNLDVRVPHDAILPGEGEAPRAPSAPYLAPEFRAVEQPAGSAAAAATILLLL